MLWPASSAFSSRGKSPLGDCWLCTNLVGVLRVVGISNEINGDVAQAQPFSELSEISDLFQIPYIVLSLSAGCVC